jgi:hypothetical protein
VAVWSLGENGLESGLSWVKDTIYFILKIFLKKSKKNYFKLIFFNILKLF